MNFCPFAEKPLKKEKLSVIEFEGGNNDDEELCQIMLEEMMRLKDESGTSLIVAPKFFPDDFISFLSFITEVESTVMEDFELHGIIQIAPFHPNFCFDGNDIDDVDNFTNRSPYPTFHLLREDEVSRAVDSIDGDSGKVWKRNVRFLHNLESNLGRHNVEKAMNGEYVHGIEDILRDTKIDINSFYERMNDK